MQRWQGQRITHPLTPAQLLDETHGNGNGQRGAASGQPSAPPAAGAPTRPLARQQAPAGQPGPRPGPGDEQELARIREILVGPQLRDHDRRLRLMERLSAELQAQQGVSPEWRAHIEAALDRERQVRDEQMQGHARLAAQLTAELRRASERIEVQAREAQSLRAEQEAARAELQALRVELAGERQQREEIEGRHAQALAELARHFDAERQAHVRLHARHSAELDARLERERRIRAEELRGTHFQQGTQIDTLYRLVDEAKQALVAMQAERDYLAGLLAELGLHLVRHAASPAAASAERATERLLGAPSAARRVPGPGRGPDMRPEPGI